jgi:hypothetical protein
MQHIHAYKLATTYKMTLMYFLVNIHINNQSTLYKVNGVVASNNFGKNNLHVDDLTIPNMRWKITQRRWSF